MTIMEALTKLSAAWPKLSIAIDCSIWAHCHDGRRQPPIVEWSIWNAEENRFYKGPTLKAAVDSALGVVDPGSVSEVEAATAELP